MPPNKEEIDLNSLPPLKHLYYSKRSELTSEHFNYLFKIKPFLLQKTKYLTAQVQVVEKVAPPKNEDKKYIKNVVKEAAEVVSIVKPKMVATEKDFLKNLIQFLMFKVFLIIDIKQIAQPEKYQDDFERMEEFVPPPPIMRLYSEKSFNYISYERKVKDEIKQSKGLSLAANPQNN
ncbi:unnamed protein product [Paramecium primaurelia]|uniref:Uncharacterized protein n=1 Tax=Paramecium primaurelia TaxID=5886 RepID=A0A8S1PQH5_PARPR|nr:unnamed protein product [Paramecium primaurelia]